MPPLDPEVGWWLQGNYAPVPDEIEAFDLEIRGALPAELTGVYARNGSNPLNGSPHWFLGHGMIHGVRLEAGKAKWYRNRFVNTQVYQDQLDFAEGIPGGDSSQSNVSVVNHNGRLLSSGEIGWMYELDPTDLSTIGLQNYSEVMGTSASAHPRIDPATGLMHTFGYHFAEPYLSYYVVDPAGDEIVHKTDVPVAGPSMMHDFLITETHAIWWDMPVLFNFDLAIGGARMPYEWTPEYGSRLWVLPLGADGSEARSVELPRNGFVFHGTNAWNEGDRIHLDVSRMDKVFHTDGSDGGESRLHRWTIDLSGDQLTMTEELLEDRPIDFPKVDERVQGRAHQHAWYVMSNGDIDADGGEGLWYEGLAHRDASTGTLDTWVSGPAIQPGEAYFVPGSDSAAEGEGWLLSYAYDQAEDRSELVVLNALDIGSGPVASVVLPRRVPFGFHGTWVPG